jgi:histone deacetylase complex regulatory component SIN3
MGQEGSKQFKKNDLKKIAEETPQQEKKERIKQKVMQSELMKKKFMEDPEILNRFVDVMSSKEGLLETYLSTDWIKTVEIVSDIRIYPT